jgi:[ribosomal protein S5]-alanine N-acetyltransferase
VQEALIPVDRANLCSSVSEGFDFAMFILETERLLFRSHEPSDLDAYCAIEADAEFRRYVGGAPRTREQAEKKFRSAHLHTPPKQLALHATIYKPEQRYIGYCGIYPHFSPAGPPIKGEGTLACYIARAYWGRGLATEAARAFLQYGFNELKLKRIVASVQQGNDASQHILEKLGFQLINTRQGPRTYLHFALDKSR